MSRFLSVRLTIFPGGGLALSSETLNCSTRYAPTELAKANDLTFILVITIPNVYSDDGICNPLRGVVSQHICCMLPGGSVHILSCGVVCIAVLLIIVNCNPFLSTASRLKTLLLVFLFLFLTW